VAPKTSSINENLNFLIFSFFETSCSSLEVYIYIILLRLHIKQYNFNLIQFQTIQYQTIQYQIYNYEDICHRLPVQIFLISASSSLSSSFSFSTSKAISPMRILHLRTFSQDAAEERCSSCGHISILLYILFPGR